MEKSSLIPMSLTILGLAVLVVASVAGMMSDVQEWAWPVGGAGILLILLGLASATMGPKSSAPRPGGADRRP